MHISHSQLFSHFSVGEDSTPPYSSVSKFILAIKNAAENHGVPPNSDGEWICISIKDIKKDQKFHESPRNLCELLGNDWTAENMRSSLPPQGLGFDEWKDEFARKFGVDRRQVDMKYNSALVFVVQKGSSMPSMVQADDAAPSWMEFAISSLRV
jgi:hypothetical protein